MTETEAKTKWCPMVRRIDSEYEDKAPTGMTAMNRMVTPKGEKAFGLCIGSACMMWRWRMEFSSVDWAGKDFEKMQEELLESDGYIAELNPMDPSGLVGKRSKKHGYCGLAEKL